MVNKDDTYAWQKVFNAGNVTSTVSVLTPSTLSIRWMYNSEFFLQTSCIYNMPLFSPSLFRFLNTLFIYLIYRVTHQCTIMTFISSCYFVFICVMTLEHLGLTQAQELCVNYIMNALQKCTWSACALLTFNTGIGSREIILYSISDTLQNHISLTSDFAAQQL